ncbi:unnamed protein product [Linum tenue]|uniref:ERCC4 domain-containing protein n=1 Tax=Linum tenue TaxID=586396 RepID=A0AAV0RCH8_9ROSI|nr:unnamed protein product [Linum tenue]
MIRSILAIASSAKILTSTIPRLFENTNPETKNRTLTPSLARSPAVPSNCSSIPSRLQSMAENPILLSDEDADDPGTPIPPLSKRLRAARAELGLDPAPTIFLIDDDPSPFKPAPNSSSALSVVPETPMSDVAAAGRRTVDLSTPEIRVPDFGVIGDDPSPFNPKQNSSSAATVVPETPMSDVAAAGRCTVDLSTPEVRVSDFGRKISGNGGVTRLEPERFESVDCSGSGNWRENETVVWRSRFSESVDSLGGANLSQMSSGVNSSHSMLLEDDQKRRSKSKSEEKNSNTDEAIEKKRKAKEERARLMEEKKQKREEEKLQKAALKAEAAELKKLEREKQKWEKGKLALKSIVAQLDAKVVEQASVGGHLLSRFAEKGLTYHITSHPIERSIMWSMSVPEHLAQLSIQEQDVRYILFIYEAEEFCNLVTSESLIKHVCKVRSQYPSYTVCYLTNKLMAYINKREKELYKNPESGSSWVRPPIEEMLAKLTTHFDKVYYRHCRDEAEVAEHVVGLTSSLASCQYRLKALVAIPKVQPRFAVAIWKKYPTMRSLLSIYMDPTKTVHEKEFLLANLTVEGVTGADRRVGEICSKRVYRIMMAESGSIKTDDVEDGADYFQR